MAETTLIRRLYGLVYRIDKKLAFLPPLLARLLIGGIFIRTGYGKLTHFKQIVAYFGPGAFPDHLSIPHPALNAGLAAGTELGVGILVLLGLFTRLAPYALAFTMLVALKTAILPGMHFHSFGDVLGLLTHEEVHYLLILVWLAIAGAGPVSLDRLLERKLGVGDATPQ